MFPVARTEKLTVRELPDETLVFDHETNKAHCLNRASALVWKHCDGKTSVAELSEMLQREMRTPHPDALAGLALEQLSRRNLLMDAIVPATGRARMSRRDILRQLAAAAVAMPAVISLTAPNARAGITGEDCAKVAPGTPCTGGSSPIGTCCMGQCLGVNDYNSNPSHCGKCNNSCSSGSFCFNGICTGSSPTTPGGNGPDRILDR